MKQEVSTRLKFLLHGLRLALPIIVLWVAEASAVPMIPLGPVDVSGTITDLRWIPAKRINGIPGMSGSAGGDRMIPAHFLAALRPYAGADAQLARLLNHMIGAGDLNPATLVVWVCGVRPNQLKIGMRVLLPSYTLFADEGGILVHHDMPVIGERPRHGR